MNLVFCVPHFGATSSSAGHVGLGDDPAWYTDAELFYVKEQENYSNDQDGLKRLAKKAAQRGFNLKRDSSSFREARDSYKKKKLSFIARDVRVKDEPATDLLIPQAFVEDPDLRAYLEEVTGDADLVQKWLEEVEQARNLPRRLRRAGRGAVDQGRPGGLRDESYTRIAELIERWRRLPLPSRRRGLVRDVFLYFGRQLSVNDKSLRRDYYRWKQCQRRQPLERA